jgi:acylpyruvate hydrolase
MKLGTLATAEGTTAAVFTDGGAAPVSGYDDVGSILRAGPEGLAAANAAQDFRPYVAADLRRPVLEPGAVICAGINFHAHVQEMGREIPEHPTLFAKLSRALADPAADVVLPASSTAVDYEGEVAVVIGRACRDVDENEAAASIAGYTLLNDVSMRDYQYRTLQWFAGKNFERSSPVGPWIVTSDEIGDASELELVVTVNDEERQRGMIGDLIHGPAALVADISQFLSLQPGDVIATGTPGGVGYARDPKVLLSAGDVVEVAVEQIGTLRTSFV